MIRPIWVSIGDARGGSWRQCNGCGALFAAGNGSASCNITATFGWHHAGVAHYPREAFAVFSLQTMFGKTDKVYDLLQASSEAALEAAREIGRESCREREIGGVVVV